MSRLLRILIALCLPAMAAAQGVRYENYNVTSANNVPFGAQSTLYTLPGSTVTVCAYPDDGGQPCGNVIPIYSDPALTQAITPPLVTDVHGRFGFWLASGTYTYSVVSQTGTFLGTYIFTLGGAGGSGCVPSVPVDAVLFSPTGTNCSGSSKFTFNPDFSLGKVDINGGAFLQIDEVDDTNFSYLNGGTFVLHNHHGSSQTGIEVDMDETTSTTGTAPLAFNAVFEVDKAGHFGSGYLTTPSLGNGIAANTVVGFQAGPLQLGTSTVGKVYGFNTSNGGGQATIEEFSFFANPQQTANIHANYCDFMSRTSDSTPVLRESIGCGTTSVSTFGGPVIAPSYQETLTTPASSSAACTAGQFTDDANFHYVCTATNTWKRVALTTF